MTDGTERTAGASTDQGPADEVATSADNRAPGPDVTEVDDRADEQVPWRVFAAISTFVLASAILYGFASGEEAGATMLAVSSILAGWCGAFLWRNARRFEAGRGAHAQVEGHEAMYLPDASPWPFGIGIGLTLVLNGLLIGTWFLVPGVMLLGVSLAGFARQSRHRR